MNVLVALDHRFTRLPDGSVWTGTFFARSFWQRYLNVFDSVSVVARVEETTVVSPSAKRVDGQGVTVLPIAHYIGPWQYLARQQQIRRQIAAAVDGAGAIILRASGQMANCVEQRLRALGRPYGVEVVADPYDVFSPGAMHHPLRPALRRWFPRQLRRQCANASAVSYVTAAALQRRYPASSRSFTTHYSSVELGSDAFCSTPRPAPLSHRPLQFLMVGTLEELYKAPDILIKAFAACRRGGLNAELRILGSGRQMAALQKMAIEQGVTERVHFLGSVAGGKAVRDELDRADLFLLPSRQEGLPRAMIEAMARALPCIGSTAGGIPELLKEQYLVPPNDSRALAAKIMELTGSGAEMEEASRRNLETSREYGEEILRKRRDALYTHLRSATAAWLRQSQLHLVNPMTQSGDKGLGEGSLI